MLIPSSSTTNSPNILGGVSSDGTSDAFSSNTESDDSSQTITPNLDAQKKIPQKNSDLENNSRSFISSAGSGTYSSIKTITWNDQSSTPTIVKKGKAATGQLNGKEISARLDNNGPVAQPGSGRFAENRGFKAASPALAFETHSPLEETSNDDAVSYVQSVGGSKYWSALSEQSFDSSAFDSSALTTHNDASQMPQQNRVESRGDMASESVNQLPSSNSIDSENAVSAWVVNHKLSSSDTVIEQDALGKSFEPDIALSLDINSEESESEMIVQGGYPSAESSASVRIGGYARGDVTPKNQQSWFHWLKSGLSYYLSGNSQSGRENTCQPITFTRGHQASKPVSNEMMPRYNEIPSRSIPETAHSVKKLPVAENFGSTRSYELGKPVNSATNTGEKIGGREPLMVNNPLSCPTIKPGLLSDSCTDQRLNLQLRDPCAADLESENRSENKPGLVNQVQQQCSYYLTQFVNLARNAFDRLQNSATDLFIDVLNPATPLASQENSKPLTNIEKVGNIIYKTAEAYLMEQCLTVGKHKITTKNKEQTLETVAKLINVLVHGFTAKEGMLPSLQEDITLDEIIIDEIIFNKVKAKITRLDDGRINIEKLSFEMNSSRLTPGKRKAISCELTNIHISCVYSTQKNLLLRNALYSIAWNSPQEAAVELCKAICPQQMDIEIERCKSDLEGHCLVRNNAAGAITEGYPTDDISFTLKDTSIRIAMNTELYPGISPGITIRPGKIEGSIESSGLISNIWGQVVMDDNRNGDMDVKINIDLSKVSFLLKLFFGVFQVKLKANIKNGTVALDDFKNQITIPSVNRVVRFFVKLVVENSINSRLSGLKIIDGNASFQFNVVLFDEEGRFKRWPNFIKWVNDKFQKVSINIPLPFSGLRPEESGKKGLGHVVLGELTRGMFPYNCSMLCKDYEELMNDAEHTQQPNDLTITEKVLNAAEKERNTYNFSTEEYLYRRLPISLAVEWAKNAKGADAQRKLLRLLAVLTDIMPHKAVKIMQGVHNNERFAKTDASGSFLVHLLQQQLVEPESGAIENTSDYCRQNGLLKDLLFFWSQNQLHLHRDCSIQNLANPEAPAEPVKAVVEKFVRASRGKVSPIASLTSAGIGSAATVITGSWAPVVGFIELALQINNLIDQSNPSNFEQFTSALEDYERSAARQMNTEPERIMAYSECSQKVSAFYLGLACKTTRKTLAGVGVNDWLDSRYWQTIGALCNAGRCSVHAAAAALRGDVCSDFFNQLPFISLYVESFTLESGVQLFIRDFLASAESKCFTEEFKDHLQRIDSAESQLPEDKKLLNMPSLAVGEESLEGIQAIEEQRLGDMVRRSHRVLENQACMEILAQVQQVQQCAEKILQNCAPSDRKSVVAWRDSQCKAMLSVLPLERMGEQLVRARRIGDAMTHPHAFKYYLTPAHRNDLANVLGQAYEYEIEAEYSPTRIVPGVLVQEHEDQLLCALSRRASASENVKELLKTHLLYRVIKDKTEQLIKSDEGNAESYQNIIAGVLLRLSGLLSTLSFGDQLLLQALKRQYSCNLKVNDGCELTGWEEQLNQLFSHDVSTLSALFSQVPATHSAVAEAELTAVETTFTKMLNTYEQSSQKPTNDVLEVLREQPVLPEETTQLTGKDMINMIRIAFSDLSYDELLPLFSPYIPVENEQLAV